MTAKLKGKVALVTGGSTGIGLATAQRLVEEGAFVFITGRRQEELEKAVAEIGRNVQAVRGDIADLADLDRLFATIKSAQGHLDIVIANAGIVEVRTTEEVTPEHFDKIFDVNARGTYFTVQKALPLITDGGSIVLTSSGMGVKGFPAYGMYAATKAAIRSFARTFAAELKDRGIRVNVVSPGPVETPILGAQFSTAEELEAGRDVFEAITPLGRLGRADEIANAIFFLASDESSFTTGIDLVADGGITQV